MEEAKKTHQDAEARAEFAKGEREEADRRRVEEAKRKREVEAERKRLVEAERKRVEKAVRRRRMEETEERRRVDEAVERRREEEAERRVLEAVGRQAGRVVRRGDEGEALVQPQPVRPAVPNLEALADQARHPLPAEFIDAPPYARWLGRKMISLEQHLKVNRTLIRRQNQELFRRTEDLPEGLPFRTLAHFVAFNNAADVTFDYLVGFFCHLAQPNAAECARAYFHAAFHIQKEVSLHVTWKGVPQRNKLSFKNSRFTRACRDAMHMNQRFEGPSEDEFIDVMTKAFKALENRRRRRDLHPLDDPDDQPPPPQRRRVDYGEIAEPDEDNFLALFDDDIPVVDEEG
ncbi:uncharacterized protein LOC107037770 [Diachasma alloeum]|uniref:uncharacterized protein LOC107037770 n=1 Tax=Diachasma alloeum TaxID=454923 RepID=UPI00073821A2|nr:uncharacterized protein LOC107037770 [Diachasma alloeum]